MQFVPHGLPIRRSSPDQGIGYSLDREISPDREKSPDQVVFLTDRAMQLLHSVTCNNESSYKKHDKAQNKIICIHSIHIDHNTYQTDYQGYISGYGRPT